MTHLIDTSDLLSLIWPLMLCAAAWGIVIWALRQRDQVSEAVNGLLSPHRSTEFASEFHSHMPRPGVTRPSRLRPLHPLPWRPDQSDHDVLVERVQASARDNLVRQSADSDQV